MPLSVLSLILGLAGSGFFTASCFSIVRRRVLVLGLVSSAVLILAYIVKDDIAASFLVMVALLRNGLFLLTRGTLIGRKIVWVVLVVGALVIWLGTTNYSKGLLVDMLPLWGTVIMVTAFAFFGMKYLKVATVVNGCLWLLYEYLTGAYTVMVGEALGVILAVVALVRLSRLGSEKV